jgi:hypothetical protein
MSLTVILGAVADLEVLLSCNKQTGYTGSGDDCTITGGWRGQYSRSTSQRIVAILPKAEHEDTTGAMRLPSVRCDPLTTTTLDTTHLVG